VPPRPSAFFRFCSACHALGRCLLDLLILGASARSAAFSAIRLGLQPVCVDLFADLDLASACPVTPVELVEYPDALADLAETLAPTAWLYTGAIENRPDLVDRISRRHFLLGNSGSTLRAVRDPIALASAVRRGGLVAPEVRIDPEGLPVDGSWLIKPLASAAGRGIHPWSGSPGALGRVYFQERVDGLPMAVLYVADGSGTRCLGITRQFVGRPGNRFAYRGSLGPWPVESEVQRKIEALGRTIAGSFGLVGLFGIDLILVNGQPWPIEVNPRYTASVEVLEWATGTSLLLEHLRAFRWASPLSASITPQGIVGKAILHADRSFRWPSSGNPPIAVPSDFPAAADIPRTGTNFRPGEPVLTVFARGDSPETCRRELGMRLRTWRRRLRPGY
jgi:predicted ATP-grasp superfamily ATP-dependent carboligase